MCFERRKSSKSKQLSSRRMQFNLIYCSYLSYFEQRRVFDPFLVPPGSAADPFQSQPNPWINDTVDFWQHDKM